MSDRRVNKTAQSHRPNLGEMIPPGPELEYYNHHTRLMVRDFARKRVNYGNNETRDALGIGSTKNRFLVDF